MPSKIDDSHFVQYRSNRLHGSAEQFAGLTIAVAIEVGMPQTQLLLGFGIDRQPISPNADICLLVEAGRAHCR
jgi:hypothetical protein